MQHHRLRLWLILLVLQMSAPTHSLRAQTRDKQPPSPIEVKTIPSADLFVDDDNSGPQDGTTRHPFKTIGQAIAAAKENAVIAVASGTYPHNIAIKDKTIKLFGGFRGASADTYVNSSGDFKTRDPSAHQTLLKGNGKDSVVTLENAGGSVVDGFVISGGGRSKLAEPAWLGGGFYVTGGSPTISNNVIEKNHTCPPVKQDEEKLGGGIYSSNADLSIVNNVIRDNVSGRGAGIAINGGKVLIRGNLVQQNIAVSDHGGGIYIYAPTCEIVANRIFRNEIGRALGYGWGGGITVVNQGKYKLSRNVFTGNFAPSVGSALFVDDGATASLDHDLMFANADNPAGEGAVPPIYIDGSAEGIGSSLALNHVTIADHVTKVDGSTGHAISVTGKSKVAVLNSILWNNGGDDIKVDETSKMTVAHTLSQKPINGAGNLSRDPLFANAPGNDYRLRSTSGRWDPSANGKQGGWVIDKDHSPAIDAASPTSPYDREPTPNGGRANLGTFGNTAQASKSAAN